MTERGAQLQDIDVIGQDGKTYSVKTQPKSLQTGRYSFELALFNEQGDAIPGNWARCQADSLAIVIPKHSVLFFDVQGLASHFTRLGVEWNVKRLTDFLVQRNIESGRKYVDALNLLVPRKELAPLAYRTVPLIELEDLTGILKEEP